MHPIDATCPRTKRRLTYGECMRLAPPEHLTESERRDLAAWAEWDREHHAEASVLEALVGRRVVLRRTFRTLVEHDARRQERRAAKLRPRKARTAAATVASPWRGRAVLPARGHGGGT